MKAAFGLGAVSTLLLVCLQCCLGGKYIDYDPVVTEKIYMDISIGSVYKGRIVFGLFGDIAPKTVLNFRTLIIGNTTDSDGVLLAYKSSIFHRTIKNFMIQGGDFTRGDGWGGKSLWGNYFKDENFLIPHYGAGWLGMANAGPDTNGSQFYITCVLTEWLNDKHTLFGVVLEGMAVVRAIENNPTGANDRPILVVVINDCGTLPLANPFTVPRSPVQG